MGSHIVYIWSTCEIKTSLFIKTDIGATYKDFSSGVLILKDGTCLTCCKLNPLTPNDLYKRRNAQLTSRRCILYIYSTNIPTEYFKHAA